MNKYIFLLAMAIGVMGCGKNLRPDPSPSAYLSNVPTAEFRACGKLFHGLGECIIEEGQSYDQIKLEVQGYYEGNIRVDSSKCQLADVYRYENSELVYIPIIGEGEKSCLVDIIVQPKYPNQRESELRVYGFKGRLLIKVIPAGTKAFVSHALIKKGIAHKFDIPYDGIGPARVFFRECDTKFDKMLPVDESGVSLNIRDLVPNIKYGDRCGFTGFVKSDQILRVSWQVWGYAENYTPLPKAILKFDKNKLSVKADPSVSVIALDNEYEVDFEAVFKNFDKEQYHILRLLTVKGRSQLIEWFPKEQKWMLVQ